MKYLTTLLAAAALGLIGCADDEIRHYRAPKSGPAPRIEAGGARQLLAAIVAREDRTWFLKVEGPAERVLEEAERFETFARSFRFGSGKELAWTLPRGWQAAPGTGMRYATLRLGGKQPPLEGTVIALGREASSILANVNRWREQMGLAHVDAEGLSRFVRPFETEDRTAATLVALTTGKEPAPASRPFRYSLPDGWREAEAQGLRAASFRVAAEDQIADISVVPLAGDAGSLLINVNRWRGQAGLEPIQEAELASGARDFDVNGAPAKYVAIQGPDCRILAVVLVRGGKTWFFKMQGPAGLVERQQPAFDSFVRSIQFVF